MNCSCDHGKYPSCESFCKKCDMNNEGFCQAIDKWVYDTFNCQNTCRYFKSQIPHTMKVKYAIGQDMGIGDCFAMWCGSTTKLSDLLTVDGKTYNSVILRYNTDGSADVIFKWSDKGWKENIT